MDFDRFTASHRCGSSSANMQKEHWRIQSAPDRSSQAFEK